MSKNIFCIGELLIDMVCIDNKGLKDGEKMEKSLIKKQVERQQMWQLVFQS